MLATFPIRMSCWRHFWFVCHVGDISDSNVMLATSLYPVTNILPVEVGCCAANATDVSLWVMEDVTMDSYIAAIGPLLKALHVEWPTPIPDNQYWRDSATTSVQRAPVTSRDRAMCSAVSSHFGTENQPWVCTRQFVPWEDFFAICSQGFKFQLGHWYHNTSVSSKLMSDNQVWTPNMYIIQLRCVFHLWFSCYLMILITLLNIYWDIGIIRYAKFALITCERLVLQNLIHFDYDVVVVWLNIVNCILPS